MNLSGMSSYQLEKLAKKASLLAGDLKKEEPTYNVALENGVEDCSYRTVRWGEISSYSGEATVTLENGTKWKCVGHKPQGNTHVVTREGFIEFIKLED